jgi:RNA polymerase sigma-70 factor (ECF subfamily)
LKGELSLSNEISKEKAEMIFKEHSNYIYRIALFLSKSKELADDITQETFIQVFRKYYTVDSTKPIQPWIYKVTLNVTRNMLRKQKWLKFIGKSPESISLNLVETTVLKTEEENELWREISNLHLKSREIIVLHFYSGMKLKEISITLEIPLGTCKSRLNTALNTLRKRLPNNNFEFLNKGGDTFETI